MKNYEEYYKQMGNLLYSVAASDGSIAPKVWKELRRMVKEELVPQEHHNDEFGSDSAFAVEFQFDLLEGNDIPANQAWEELEEYLKHNAPLLPVADKERLMDGARKVAASFHGINKEEKSLLGKLEKLLSHS